MNKRKDIMRNSTLPYSFMYKIKKQFYGKECPICKSIMDIDKEYGFKTRIPSIQHNIPISKGGLHELHNISIICKKCNVTIKDTITGNLNNKEVIKEWDIIK